MVETFCLHVDVVVHEEKIRQPVFTTKQSISVRDTVPERATSESIQPSRVY